MHDCESKKRKNYKIVNIFTMWPYWTQTPDRRAMNFTIWEEGFIESKTV